MKIFFGKKFSPFSPVLEEVLASYQLIHHHLLPSLLLVLRYCCIKMLCSSLDLSAESWLSGWSIMSISSAWSASFLFGGGCFLMRNLSIVIIYQICIDIQIILPIILRFRSQTQNPVQKDKDIRLFGVLPKHTHMMASLSTKESHLWTAKCENCTHLHAFIESIFMWRCTASNYSLFLFGR